MGIYRSRVLPPLMNAVMNSEENDTMAVFQHPKEPKVFGWTFEGRAGPST
jgi:hypothetical protein